MVQLLTNELTPLKVQLEQLTTWVEAFVLLDERLVRVETTQERIMEMMERLSMEKHEAEAKQPRSGEQGEEEEDYLPISSLGSPL